MVGQPHPCGEAGFSGSRKKRGFYDNGKSEIQAHFVY